MESKMILELMMHLGVLFYGLGACLAIASPIVKILWNNTHRDFGTRNVFRCHSSSVLVTNSTFPEGWIMNIIFHENLNVHDASADGAPKTAQSATYATADMGPASIAETQVHARQHRGANSRIPKGRRRHTKRFWDQEKTTQE